MRLYLRPCVQIAAIILVAFLASCGRESYWERTLVGPFQCEPFSGQITNKPVSSLPLSPQYVLDVHLEGTTNVPILRLRQTNGTDVWARLLVAQLKGQAEPRGRITQMTLNEVKTARDGFKVKFVCDWTGGGKEGGLVYLDANYGFRNFAMSW